MDRRSWLWQRKSSEKNPNGETESSGSASSHSGRFSDDQIFLRTLSIHNTQSPEVTSKAAGDDELNDSVKTPSERLTEALLEIRSKEDLVKQHSKVAEEAVSGWERAENEVFILKKQVDALTQKNSILEERVGHLDGALKECLRQLRQAREEQEKKIYDAVTKTNYSKTNSERESTRSQLENQLQNAKTDAIDAAMVADCCSKLEAAEKENSNLKLKLLFQAEELELSTHAAETASKQHLEGRKKVAKLEAECRRLKAVANKASVRSVTASSIYVDSVTDSFSENGERMLVVENESCKISVLSIESENEKTPRRNHVVPAVEIDLMDDFLEMERLAALPEPDYGENPQIELKTMINPTAELEENSNKIEIERVNLEIALYECRYQLKMSEDQLKQTQVALMDLSNQLALANETKSAAEKEVEFTKVKLKNATKLLDDAEGNLVEIQTQLTDANVAKTTVELELKNANVNKTEADSKLKVMEHELHTLRSSICALEEEAKKERKNSQEALAKCEMLDTEISRLKVDSQFQRSALVDEFRINQDKELEVAASKFAECQKTIASLGRQLKSLASLEDLLIDSEKPAAVHREGT